MKHFAALLMSVGMAIILTNVSIAAPLNYEDYPIIKLRSLDKITARTMNFEAKVGSTIRFGDIFIKVQACRKPPPIEKNEAAAFLQIYQANEATPDEKNNDSKSSWIFSGWMFASSPAISAMDHPIYDVWVLDCLGRDPEPLPPPEQQAAEAEVKEEAKETPENKEQNVDSAEQKMAPNDAAPSEPKTEEMAPATINKESAPPSAEPSVDEILQPEKATSETGTQNDDDFIYSPPKPTSDSVPTASPEQNDTPLTEPNSPPENSIDNSAPQETTPTEPQEENPSSQIDGIY